jgi:hypothetical protein
MGRIRKNGNSHRLGRNTRDLKISVCRRFCLREPIFVTLCTGRKLRTHGHPVSRHTTFVQNLSSNGASRPERQENVIASLRVDVKRGMCRHHSRVACGDLILPLRWRPIEGELPGSICLRTPGLLSHTHCNLHTGPSTLLTPPGIARRKQRKHQDGRGSHIYLEARASLPVPVLNF